MRSDTIVIFQLAVGYHRLAQFLKNFWRDPLPMFDMAICERQATTLIVSVCGQVEPIAVPGISGNGNSEKRVEYTAFVHVYEHKEIGGRRTDDLGKLFVRR